MIPHSEFTSQCKKYFFSKKRLYHWKICCFDGLILSKLLMMYVSAFTITKCCYFLGLLWKYSTYSLGFHHQLMESWKHFIFDPPSLNVCATFSWYCLFFNKIFQLNFLSFNLCNDKLSFCIHCTSRTIGCQFYALFWLWWEIATTDL